MRRLSSSGLHDNSLGEWKAHPGRRGWNQVTAGFKSVTGRRIVPASVLLICMISLLHRMRDQTHISASQISGPTVWSYAQFTDWHASCATRSSDWCNDQLVVKMCSLRSSCLIAVSADDASVVAVNQSVMKGSELCSDFRYLTRIFLRGMLRCMQVTSQVTYGYEYTLAIDPSRGSNGYLVVRCNGGLNQQRTAICNAVLAARIMNATLVLPELDTNSWHDQSGFPGIYDVEHFISSLKKDVRVIQTIPATRTVGSKKLKLRPFQLKPPRDASVSWYETTALEKMKKHGAVYLTPFSHRLDEKLDNHEYQRLRCRVNYHALRFSDNIRNLSSMIVQRLRSGGPYMAIHLRFELDMLAFSGCLDIFTPEEQEVLKKYRTENFAQKKLEYTRRPLIGKCPLTPKEVGLFLQAMGFDNSTRIYLAIGEVFGGERFLKPLRDLFPHLETRSTVALPDELALVSAQGHGLLGSAVDYMVCLLSDIFVPTYDGPSNFANNLIGQRLYYGFRTTLQPDRKGLAPLFIDLEKGRLQRSDFEELVKGIMSSKFFVRLHTRDPSESFYTNPWPECFCKTFSTEETYKCPSAEPVGLDTNEDEGLVEQNQFH